MRFAQRLKNSASSRDTATLMSSMEVKGKEHPVVTLDADIAGQFAEPGEQPRRVADSDADEHQHQPHNDEQLGHNPNCSPHFSPGPRSGEPVPAHEDKQVARWARPEHIPFLVNLQCPAELPCVLSLACCTVRNTGQA